MRSIRAIGICFNGDKQVTPVILGWNHAIDKNGVANVALVKIRKPAIFD
jgi:hypothetical protein